MAVAITRVSASSTAAVNTLQTLAVLGANTAAGNVVVPPDVTHCIGVITSYCSNATTVGAEAAGIQVAFVKSGTQFFLAGASGGQNATGENSNAAPSDLVPTNIPVSVGETFGISGAAQLVDQGTQGYGCTVIFGKGDGSYRTYHDIRVASATALNTSVAMNTRMTDTGAGGFALLDTYASIYGYSVVAPSSSAAVGQSTGQVELSGGASLEAGQQSMLAGCSGGTLNTSSAVIVPAKYYPFNAWVKGPGTITGLATLAQVDSGEMAIGMGLHFKGKA